MALIRGRVLMFSWEYHVIFTWWFSFIIVTISYCKQVALVPSQLNINLPGEPWVWLFDIVTRFTVNTWTGICPPLGIFIIWCSLSSQERLLHKNYFSDQRCACNKVATEGHESFSFKYIVFIDIFTRSQIRTYPCKARGSLLGQAQFKVHLSSKPV